MIEAAQRLLEPGDVGVDLPLQAAIADEAAAVLLGHEHLAELAAAREEFAQRAGLLIGDGAGRRAHVLREASNEASVEAIRLGQLANGPAVGGSGEG